MRAMCPSSRTRSSTPPLSPVRVLRWWRCDLIGECLLHTQVVHPNDGEPEQNECPMHEGGGGESEVDALTRQQGVSIGEVALQVLLRFPSLWCVLCSR